MPLFWLCHPPSPLPESLVDLYGLFALCRSLPEERQTSQRIGAPGPGPPYPNHRDQGIRGGCPGLAGLEELLTVGHLQPACEVSEETGLNEVLGETPLSSWMVSVLKGKVSSLYPVGLGQLLGTLAGMSSSTECRLFGDRWQGSLDSLKLNMNGPWPVWSALSKIRL